MRYYKFKTSENISVCADRHTVSCGMVKSVVFPPTKDLHEIYFGIYLRSTCLYKHFLIKKLCL